MTVAPPTVPLVTLEARHHAVVTAPSALRRSQQAFGGRQLSGRRLGLVLAVLLVLSVSRFGASLGAVKRKVVVFLYIDLEGVFIVVFQDVNIFFFVRVLRMWVVMGQHVP